MRGVGPSSLVVMTKEATQDAPSGPTQMNTVLRCPKFVLIFHISSFVLNIVH